MHCCDFSNTPINQEENIWRRLSEKKKNCPTMTYGPSHSPPLVHLLISFHLIFYQINHRLIRENLDVNTVGFYLKKDALSFLTCYINILKLVMKHVLYIREFKQEKGKLNEAFLSISFNQVILLWLNAVLAPGILLLDCLCNCQRNILFLILD